MFSASVAASQFRCQRDNFWRIWTTFFKLDTCIAHPNISDEFDNWHCRPIQNGRRWPFCQKSKKKKVSYGSEMARNAIESEFRTTKMADWSEMVRNAIQVIFGHSKWPPEKIKKFCIDLKWAELWSKVNFGNPNGRSIWNGQKCDRKCISDIQNGRCQPFCQRFQKKLKLRIDLKWPEMRSKVNFGHPKWPTSHILSKIYKKIEVAYRSEMARNAIESDFRTSKMAAGSHFVNNLTKKIKILYWSKMARNVIQSEFRTSKMADGSHFVKNFKTN